MKKFEYKIVDLSISSKNASDQLNELGNEGWELSAVAWTPEDNTRLFAYLKREKQVEINPSHEYNEDLPW